MRADAEMPPWRSAIEALVTRLTQPGLGFRKAALLWICAFSIVMIACAAFFLILFWLIS